MLQPQRVSSIKAHIPSTRNSHSRDALETMRLVAAPNRIMLSNELAYVLPTSILRLRCASETISLVCKLRNRDWDSYLIPTRRLTEWQTLAR